MKKVTVFALIVVIAAVVAAWPWLHKEVAIDKCLDAGGRWNYEAGECEGARKQ
jgi:hypothetical protein